MVGVVIVSHSEGIALGAKELSAQMAKEVAIEAAGGTKDGRIGTDVQKIFDAINKVYSDDGVIVIFDLGSALMNAEMEVELLDSDKQDKVKIVDCALVEGAISACVEASLGNSINQIQESLKPLALNKL